jgi:hypothetical protein
MILLPAAAKVAAGFFINHQSWLLRCSPAFPVLPGKILLK